MKLLAITILFSISTFLAACQEHKPSKTIDEVFKQEQFDTSIIHGLPLYDSIKNILIANVDTIFNYRLAKHPPVQGPDLVQQIMAFYDFVYMPDGGGSDDKISIETLPPSIFPKIDSLCHQLGKKRLSGFQLERTNVTVFVKYKYDEETDSETGHELQWNYTTIKSPDSMIKDSALGNKWTYEIWTEERLGR